MSVLGSSGVAAYSAPCAALTNRCDRLLRSVRGSDRIHLMPTVIVTEYEHVNDLLPMVCAKCGNRAEVHVSRPIRFLGSDWAGVRTPALIFGLLFFPPLFCLIAYRYAEIIRVRIPMCETHKDDWHWRDRVMFGLLIPGWTLTVLVLHAFGLAYLIQGDGDTAAVCFLSPVVVVVMTAVIENLIVLWGAVRTAKTADQKLDVRLSSVHPEFVAALAEDRARDRVDNPERRVPDGDLLRDYDDELA